MTDIPEYVALLKLVRIQKQDKLGSCGLLTRAFDPWDSTPLEVFTVLAS